LSVQTRCSAAAVLTMMLLILGVVPGAHASGGGPEPAPESETPEYLFHMTAGNATYEAGMLTLKSVDNETTVFTDRPERDAFAVHTMSTITAMFAAVSAGDLDDDDSFIVDPPNAAFSCALSSGEVVRSVFVLRTPLQSDSIVTFDAELLYSSVSGAIECVGPAVRCFREV